MADEVFSLLRHEADLRRPRWRWLPPWRDAVLAALVVYGLLLGLYVAARPAPAAGLPGRIELVDPFSRQMVTCPLVSAAPVPTYHCTAREGR